jgi:hypothetical protein
MDILARTGWGRKRANDTEEMFGGMSIKEIDMVEEKTAAGRKKCSASQAARPECVLVVEVTDHELA